MLALVLYVYKISLILLTSVASCHFDKYGISLCEIQASGFNEQTLNEDISTTIYLKQTKFNLSFYLVSITLS